MSMANKWRVFHEEHHEKESKPNTSHTDERLISSRGKPDLEGMIGQFERKEYQLPIGQK